ncbi:protein mono-ADP-ribosyltransferase PARP11-like [Harmonia axyridis]|uniref:protein mono-ADP-ribosyltransferase PARP11-like n=1 Tax=Harmonia axyridis TaxID=115357 RepID=UPI001E275E29|nr:protein mono-ADP-ribosyltransferase PARP11-like [Harmonia axyridis]XP_045462107.1 protein mono-ADP-ribosyltransferase PARP11-like [Harmonia axyridis]
MSSTPNEGFTLEELKKTDIDYIKAKQLVENSKNKKLVVTSIHRINNPNVEKRYEKALKMKKIEYPQMKEVLLFHGTSWDNVNSICKHNFQIDLCKTYDWGKMIYLTESSKLASDFPAEQILNIDRCMFGCQVQIGNELDTDTIQAVSRRQDSHPGYDTKYKQLVGNNGYVYFHHGIVAKWETDEILPKFLIKYMVTTK